MEQNFVDNTRRRSYLRAKIYTDLLSKGALERQLHQDEKQLFQNICLGKILSAEMKIKEGSGSSVLDISGEPVGRGLDGYIDIISEEDLLRYAVSPPKLSTPAKNYLRESMDSILLSMSEMLHGNEHDAAEIHGDNWNLLEQLKACVNEACLIQADIDTACRGIARRTLEIKEVLKISKILSLQGATDARIQQLHSNLHDDLLDAIEKISPYQAGVRSANNNFHTAAIEMPLVKLSLIYTQAQRALYTHHSTSISNANVAKALLVAHGKLKQEEKTMKEVERTLDQKINEYELLLTVVDVGGGYQQVIDDWTITKRETEECKKDLRRLGWTGD